MFFFVVNYVIIDIITYVRMIFMFYRNQNNYGGKQNQESLGQRFVRSFKKNYLVSFFLIGMVGGAVLDYSLGTMPKFTCGGMVSAIFIGSCANVKAKNEKKNQGNGKKIEGDGKGKTLL